MAPRPTPLANHAATLPPFRGDLAWRYPLKSAPVRSLPTPVCRWTFQEDAGQPRWSKGRERYALREMAGPVARVEDGVLGRYALSLSEGQWLRIPRAQCPALDFHGADASFTLVAWVKRRNKSHRECQAVAGMWNETVGTRQYGMFLDLHIWDSAHQACGHLSATGVASPGYRFCMEAAIGATAVGLEEWHQIAFTYDGVWACIYLDGQLDYRPGLNPYFWHQPINQCGSGGSDFTVGTQCRAGALGNWYVGLIGGLAVYDQALGADLIAKLHAERRA
jgi:hypothetical protein